MKVECITYAIRENINWYLAVLPRKRCGNISDTVETVPSALWLSSLWKQQTCADPSTPENNMRIQLQSE